jgi:hypothetical protein
VINKPPAKLFSITHGYGGKYCLVISGGPIVEGCGEKFDSWEEADKVCRRRNEIAERWREERK